ncbi:MAG TPA: VCBS repeat-containing protein, partial [Methylomirabilota bacterium]|nr:VCBS repeat-containing protein [Methylomirabilota bacterium]
MACGAVPAAAIGEALEWREGEGHRWARLREAGESGPGFTRLPPGRTGVLFTNQLARERYTTNQIYLNGSGVALGDIDGDGWVDVYLCGLDGPNVLYRNLGDWRFEDITASAGVACEDLDATGAVFADLNGNGHLDLAVSSIHGGIRIFFNDGGGRFKPRTADRPLNPGRGGMTLAFADVDGNGTLDMYAANYRAATIRDQLTARFTVKMVDGRPVVVGINDRPLRPEDAGRFLLAPDGQVIENGEADVL